MDKQQTHHLLDQLNPGQLAAISNLLGVMVDPVARAVAAAAPDDEPVTEDDRRVREGSIWFAKRGGKGIPTEEVLAQSGARRTISDSIRAFALA